MNRLCRLALQASFSVLLLAAVLLLIAQSNIRRVSGQSDCKSLGVVSAASFELKLAPESIAAGFGENLATSVGVASTQPLPTQLAGTTVKVKDSAGVERLSPLFFVSPDQVNFLIPAGMATGTATITVTSGDGKCSTGTAPITKAAPSLFTANADGRSVPAAVAVRVRSDGIPIYEPVARFDQAQQRYVTLPLSLGPENEPVTLILYGTGIRGRDNQADVTVQIGGVTAEVRYAAEAPGFVGLDQVNAGPVPRSLIGRGKVNIALTINNFGSANLTEIEIAGAGGNSPPQISGFSKDIVRAGETLTISGTGFSSNPAENLVRIGDTEARPVISASQTQLTVRAPFGAKTAPVSVRAPGGENRSASQLNVQTSISGFVQNTASPPQPLKDVEIRVRLQDRTLSTRTNSEGTFILTGVPAASALGFDVFGAPDGPTVGVDPPFPNNLGLKMPVEANRDNQYPAIISLQQGSGASIHVSSNSQVLLSGNTVESPPIPLAPNQTGPTGNVTLELRPGTIAEFPPGTERGILRLTLVENQRTPAKLPPNIFSSAIVQISDLGVRLNPGGKLTFPNTDKLPANTQATLYRLDQRRNSPKFGEFIDSGRATVSANGQRIETDTNAVEETTIYFVAAQRLTTTVTGRVVDSDGATPVRQARVRCRGQRAFTDGNGGFTIRDVLVNEGDELSVEASFQRTILGGRVDRIQRDKIPAVVNGVTEVGNLILPSEDSNRPPVILVPTDLTMAAGETLNIIFVASDPDPGGRVVSVVIIPPRSFITLTPGSNDTYNLRIAPLSNDAGTYTQRLTATDNLGASLTFDIRLQVNRPLVANPQE